MSFRLLALCTVAAFAVVPATTVAAPPVAAPMRITIDISVKNHDGAASPNDFAVRAGGTSRSASATTAGSSTPSRSVHSGSAC